VAVLGYRYRFIYNVFNSMEMFVGLITRTNYVASVVLLHKYCTFLQRNSLYNCIESKKKTTTTVCFQPVKY
jgi:hypothetical protein